MTRLQDTEVKSASFLEGSAELPNTAAKLPAEVSPWERRDWHVDILNSASWEIIMGMWTLSYEYCSSKLRGGGKRR